MTTNKLFLVLSWIVIFSNLGKAQNLEHGFTISYGLSKITDNNPNGYQTQISPISWKLGGFYEKKISPKSNIGLEVLWVQIGAKAVNSNYKLLRFIGGELDTIGTVTRTKYTNLSYLGIPFFYKYKIDKFGFRGGIQFMILIVGSSYNETDGERNGEPYYYKSSTKNADVPRFDFGPILGFDYKINKRYSVKMEIYFGIIDLSKSTRKKSYNRQLSFGLNYAFK